MDDNLILHDYRPTRADAVHNRALLLETAKRLFAEQGVEAVPMSAIAEAAGVGKGTLYRHFENKSALCHALLDEDQKDLQERTLRRLQSRADPQADLKWFLEQVAWFVERNKALLCVASGDSHLVSLAYPAHIWWRQTIRGLLEQLAVEGDLDYLADVLYVMLDVHVIYFQRDILGYDMARVVAGLHSILLRLLS